MTRRLVLIDLYWTRDKDPRMPLGHASLLAALARQPDIDAVSIVRAVNEFDTLELIDSVLAATAGWSARDVDVAIGVYVWGELVVQQLLVALRSAGFSGRIILGGPQISYAPPQIARLYPLADVFVRGYGEQALVELAMQPGRPRIHGVTYRTDLVDPGLRAEIDLESLPSPWLDGIIVPQRFIRWETRRGCPYRCSFCQHREAGQRLEHDVLDERRVRAEIDLFCRSGVEDIAVLDPVFCGATRSDVERASSLLEHFAEQGFAGRLSLQCRPECIDERFLAACASLDVHLEFGLQTVNEAEWKAIRRGNVLPRVDATLAACQARNIDHEVTLIFGLPNQTLQSFERSVGWCLARSVPVIKAFPLMLLRGTALADERARWHLRESEGPMPVVISSSSFDEHDWREMARLSDALRASEGHHPPSIDELRRHADQLAEIDLSRWQPTISDQLEEVAHADRI